MTFDISSRYFLLAILLTIEKLFSPLDLLRISSFLISQNVVRTELHMHSNIEKAVITTQH